MIRVLIVDDHAVVRRGLRQILSDEFAEGEFGEAANVREALMELQKGKWSLVVLDLDMPGRSALDLLSDLRRSRPKLPVLILSIHPENQLAVRTLRAGARGYLTKESAPEELINAVKTVLSGSKYVSPSLAILLAEELQQRPKASLLAALSDREYEVMCRIASGLTAKETASELGLSVKTINTYRLRLLKKMKMKNSAELIRYAVEKKLVT